MLRSLKNKTEGFTIIEVMIVLAIAALILVVVLIAVPQLQKSQRNAARRDILGRVKTEVDNYSGNNNGDIPLDSGTGAKAFTDTGAGFPFRYLNNNNYNDPSTGALAVAYWASDAAVSSGNVGTIYYKTSRTCTGETSQSSTSSRNYILMVKLDGGAVFCLDNK